MKIFLDTAEVSKIKELYTTGLVDGITTNPTLIMKSGRKQEEAIKDICKIVKGPISVEGIGESAEQMVKDGREFAKWAPNIVVKVPMTAEGLKAVKEFSKAGIKTNVTLVFSANQALLAAKAGATYVSPFVGRLDDISKDGMALVEEIMQIYKNYGFKTEVIVASVRNTQHVLKAAMIGANICTLPPKVFEEMFKHQLTDKGIMLFLEDYKKALQSNKK
ncbi:MAG: fructose-6-phosphate aldolase [Candidatus Micrarchaeia archaeon]|jgi:transaldolase